MSESKSLFGDYHEWHISDWDDFPQITGNKCI